MTTALNTPLARRAAGVALGIVTITVALAPLFQAAARIIL